MMGGACCYATAPPVKTFARRIVGPRAAEEICCNILRTALLSGAWASPLLSDSHKTH